MWKLLNPVLVANTQMRMNNEGLCLYDYMLIVTGKPSPFSRMLLMPFFVVILLYPTNVCQLAYQWERSAWFCWVQHWYHLLVSLEQSNTEQMFQEIYWSWVLRNILCYEFKKWVAHILALFKANHIYAWEDLL